MYPWRSISQVKNDFFQYATLENIAVGGLGHFAIHIDSDLLLVRWRGEARGCFDCDGALQVAPRLA